MGIFLTDKLKEWINVPAMLSTGEHSDLRGVLKYGINLPVASRLPIKEYNINKRDRVGLRRTGYWFVATNEQTEVENHRLKLLTGHINSAGDIISGVGLLGFNSILSCFDSPTFVRYLIRK